RHLRQPAPPTPVRAIQPTPTDGQRCRALANATRTPIRTPDLVSEKLPPARGPCEVSETLSVHAQYVEEEADQEQLHGCLRCEQPGDARRPVVWSTGAMGGDRPDSHRDREQPYGHQEFEVDVNVGPGRAVIPGVSGRWRRHGSVRKPSNHDPDRCRSDGEP